MMFWSKKRGPNAKPRLRATCNRNRQVLGPIVLGLVFFLSTVVMISVKRKRFDNRLRRQVHRNECSKLQQFEICSHQLLNPPSGGGVDGSLKAMTSLWKSGIRCFDVDTVTLKDGTQLASHPSRFSARIGDSKSAKPEDYTLQEAREAGADAEAFPVLETLLRHYSSLVKENTTTTSDNFKRKRLPGPLLNLDLKGPKLTAGHLQVIQETVNGFDIRDNVAICVTALKNGDVGPGVDMLKELGRTPSEGILGLVLRDQETSDWDVSRIRSIVEDNKAVRLYVASYKFEPPYFAKLKDMPVVVWTVDDKDSLLHSVQSGVAAAVSNHPMQLLLTLNQILDEAKCIN
eukprot:scaffold345_cov134-Cylindrotheca_fusiformis.AAC.14